MRTDSTIQIFRSVLENAIGTARGINDGGIECGTVFVLDQSIFEEIAENLSHRWNDQHGVDGIALTNESAAEFLEETYPETDETSRGCRDND
jgi:hypothetical protein